MKKLKTAKHLLLAAFISAFSVSCATSINTSVRQESELRKIESFAAVEVSGLRDSGIVYRALVSGLRDNGFTVIQGGTSDEDELRNVGLKMNTDGVIFGYVTRIDQRSWVTDGEEDIRVRETSRGTRERVRYEPPKVITNKTAYVRLKALDGLNGYVIWDSEGFISDEAGVDTVYMIESITKKMLQDLPEPAPKAAVAAEPVSQPIAVGRKAPDFVSETVGGDRVTLSDFQNKKVVVLNFWGIRCLPCLQEMPKLEAIYQHYKADGVEMLGVNVDGVGGDVITKNLRKQIDGVELNVTYPLLLDEDFSIIDDYYLTVAPLTLIIDLDGTIRYMHTDYQPGDEIELDAAIKDVLNQG